MTARMIPRTRRPMDDTYYKLADKLRSMRVSALRRRGVPERIINELVFGDSYWIYDAERHGPDRT